MLHLQLTGRLHGYCEEEGEELLRLRSLIEVDDRINISNRSLFRKHDACHSCTFDKALIMSEFQRRLAMINSSFSRAVTLSGHGKTKATLSSVELPNVDSADSNAVLLWQNLDVCLIWNLKHVWASHLASDLGKTNSQCWSVQESRKRFFTAKKGHVQGKV